VRDLRERGRMLAEDEWNQVALARRLCETYVCSYPPVSENIGIGVMRSLGAEVCV
jgi:hypothetical protein